MEAQEPKILFRNFLKQIKGGRKGVRNKTEAALV